MKRVALLFFDLSLIACATIIAMLLRDNCEFSEPHFRALLPYLFVTLISGAIVFSTSGTSWSVWRTSSLNDYVRLAVSSAITVVLAVGISFHISRLDGVARSVPVLQAMSVVLLLVGARLVTRIRHHRRFRPTQLVRKPLSSNRTNVLVFGTTRLAELYLRSVQEFARDNISVAGVISRTEAKVGRRFLGSQILGTPDDVMNVISDLEVHGINVDKICVARPLRTLTEKEHQQLAAIELETTIEIVYLEDAILGATISPTDRGPIQAQSKAQSVGLSFNICEDQLEALARRPFWRAKRLFDVALAASLAFILSPVIVCVAVLAAIDVGLPIVFWQQRPGVGGHAFRLYKLRTMAAAHDADGQRIADDQRSSAIGRFLRKSRLDELPQLYNILIGEMSFVGPRPLLPHDQPVGLAARTLIRPGLTGWAQVNGGRDVSPADKFALDVWYIQNATLRLDLKIFARTALMIMFGEHVNRQAIRTAWAELCSSDICGPFSLDLTDRLRSARAVVSRDPGPARAA